MEFWHGMWEFKSPGAPCFTAPVKPKARHLLNSVSSSTSAEMIVDARKQSQTGDTMNSPPSTFSETPKHDDDVSCVGITFLRGFFFKFLCFKCLKIGIVGILAQRLCFS